MLSQLAAFQLVFWSFHNINKICDWEQLYWKFGFIIIQYKWAQPIGEKQMHTGLTQRNQYATITISKFYQCMKNSIFACRFHSQMYRIFCYTHTQGCTVFFLSFCFIPFLSVAFSFKLHTVEKSHRGLFFSSNVFFFHLLERGAWLWVRREVVKVIFQLRRWCRWH